jgi:hypothetical protein
MTPTCIDQMTTNQLKTSNSVVQIFNCVVIIEEKVKSLPHVQ